jgi:hypothetical protein
MQDLSTPWEAQWKPAGRRLRPALYLLVKSRANCHRSLAACSYSVLCIQFLPEATPRQLELVIKCYVNLV